VPDAATTSSVAAVPGQPEEVERLRAENAELRRRVDDAEVAIAVLRREALERRSQVRQLAESLPTAVSRRAMLVQMADDVLHHPDKAGMARRAVAKLGRAPRKLVRSLSGRLHADGEPR
jgi:hypothetical protein